MSMDPTTPASLMRMAAERGDLTSVKKNLSATSPMDEPADDGLTGFAVALALKHKDIVSAMLKSNLPNKDENIFLAQEVLQLSPRRDFQLKDLQAAISETFKSLGVPIERLPVVEINQITVEQKFFPYVNPDVEWQTHYHMNKNWQEQEIHSAILSKNWIVQFETLKHMILGNFCIESTSSGDSKWELQGVKLHPCTHKILSGQNFVGTSSNVYPQPHESMGFSHCREIDCDIIHDMITLSKLLERKLLESGELMKNLQPRLVLVGSTQEGTRVGLGNEIDLTMNFKAWEKCPPFKICNDAFHLYKSDTCPKWMDIYFSSEYQFELESFIYDICQAVRTTIAIIYSKKLNPSRLAQVMSNEAYRRNTCRDCKKLNKKEKLWFFQCPLCIVCVSRTKMGVCLQFKWIHKALAKPVFCSIDLVPVYQIKSEETKFIIRLVNMAMTGILHPPVWFRHLISFLKEDRIVEELWSEGEKVNKVLLKSLGGNNYFIRGGQRLNTEELSQNELLLNAYVILKILRSYLDIDEVSNFMMKKMLMGPTFAYMAVSERVSVDQLLQKILQHDKFRFYFEPHIDLQKMQVKRLKDKRPYLESSAFSMLSLESRELTQEEVEEDEKAKEDEYGFCDYDNDDDHDDHDDGK